MRQLLLTDFIQNPTILFSIFIGVIFELILTQSISHTLILFGIPYLTSLILHYKFRTKKVKSPKRISHQYRNSRARLE